MSDLTRTLEIRPEHWRKACEAVPPGQSDTAQCVLAQAARDAFPEWRGRPLSAGFYTINLKYETGVVAQQWDAEDSADRGRAVAIVYQFDYRRVSDAEPPFTEPVRITVRQRAGIRLLKAAGLA